MDSSTSSHLSSKPQYQKVLVIIELMNSSPNSVWFLRMAKKLLSEHTTSRYIRLMWWLILIASLANLTSRSLRVFFRDQGGRILVPSPSIRSYGPRQPAYTRPRRLSFMNSWDCSLPPWLSSVYSRVWVHLMGNSSRVGLSMIITSDSGTHQLVKSFASFQHPRLMELPSHLLWLNLPLPTDLSLFGMDMEIQYVFWRLPAIWNGYTNVAFIRARRIAMSCKGCEMEWVMGRDNEPLFLVPVEHRTCHRLERYLGYSKRRQRAWTSLTQGSAESHW